MGNNCVPQRSNKGSNKGSMGSIYPTQNDIEILTRDGEPTFYVEEPSEADIKRSKLEKIAKNNPQLLFAKTNVGACFKPVLRNADPKKSNEEFPTEESDGKTVTIEI